MRPPGSHLEGYWEFPGGKQEKGESLRACLEREITEELGVTITADESLFSVEHEYDTKRITLHFFSCGSLEGEPKLLQSQQIKWVSPSELRHYSFPPPDRKIIDALSMFDRVKEKSLKRILMGMKRAHLSD